MTEKHFEIILGALAETLEAKTQENGYLKFKVESLERKLAEAEYHLNPHGKEKPNND